MVVASGVSSPISSAAAWLGLSPPPQYVVFNFDEPDRMIELAEAHGMAVRGHTLVWEQATVDATPEYVTAITDPGAIAAGRELRTETSVLWIARWPAERTVASV